MIMEYVSGGELFDYIVKHGKVIIYSWNTIIIFSVLNTGLESKWGREITYNSRLIFQANVPIIVY